MEFRDIEYFSVLARHGHLGRAAEALSLSQSALSKSLRRLEEEMRTKLVNRTPKGVELTAEGATLLTHANRLRSSLDDVVREVADVRRGLAGHLRVGAGQGYFFHLLPAACAVLTKDAPNAMLSLRELAYGDAVQALRNGELDIVIIESRGSREDDLVLLEKLYDDRRVVIASASHRLAMKKSVTLGDVARERWTVQGPASVMSRALHAAFESRGLPPPRVTIETGATALRCPLVASSDLLGYTWASIMRQAMRYLPLSELKVAELSTTFASNVLYRKGAYLSPLARRFIEILKATAPQMSEGAS